MVNWPLIIFFAFVVFILLTVFKALTADKVMQSVYWLILMLVGVSFIFLLANSEILFVYQLMVYSGGIAVLMLFAGLLTNQDELFIDSSILGFARTTKYQLILFVIFTVDVILLVLNSISGSSFSVTDLGDKTRTYEQAFAQLKGFAIYLWDDLSEVILVLGFTLLVAILGSVKLVIREKDLEELSEEYLARIALAQESITSLPGMEDIEVEA